MNTNKTFTDVFGNINSSEVIAAAQAQSVTVADYLHSSYIQMSQDNPVEYPMDVDIDFDKLAEEITESYGTF
jgi:hypothetical protein